MYILTQKRKWFFSSRTTFITKICITQGSQENNNKVSHWSICLLYVSTTLSLYSSFLVSFETGKCESCNPLLFKIALYLYARRIFICILDQFVNLCKGASWDSNRNWFESVDILGEYCHLNNIKSSNSWIWDIFPSV